MYCLCVKGGAQLAVERIEQQGGLYLYKTSALTKDKPHRRKALFTSAEGHDRVAQCFLIDSMEHN